MTEPALAAGIRFATANQLDEAERCLHLALEQQGGHPAALSILGDVLRRQGRIDEAMPLLEAAVQMAPQWPDAHINLGIALCELERLDAAEGSLRTAIGLKTSDPRGYNNLAVVLKLQGDLPQSLACLDTVLRLAPDFPAARLNRAMTLLLTGDFEAGWAEYERRPRWPRQLDRPLHAYLHSGASLQGRTVLLYAEQGLGDLVQFLRYAAVLADLGARVLVWCSAHMVPLACSARGVAGAFAWEETPPEFDLDCHLLSLPLILHPKSSTLPVTVPYLHPDPGLTETWRARIPQGGRLRVGIAWGGNAGNSYDRRRSLALPQLLPILRDAEVQVFALQRGPRAAEIADIDEAWRPLNLEHDDGSILDSAAAMLSLDLIVSVDTMVAHLAGALGRPVWLLLPFAPDWRWMTRRSDSPWYPTMRLFRQPRPGDWTAVIDDLVQVLRQVRGSGSCLW